MVYIVNHFTNYNYTLISQRNNVQPSSCGLERLIKTVKRVRYIVLSIQDTDLEIRGIVDCRKTSNYQLQILFPLISDIA